jgi:hypothetical protein
VSKQLHATRLRKSYFILITFKFGKTDDRNCRRSSTVADVWMFAGDSSGENPAEAEDVPECLPDARIIGQFNSVAQIRKAATTYRQKPAITRALGSSYSLVPVYAGR